MHASWNLVARSTRAEAAVIGRMAIFLAVAGFLPALVAEFHLRCLTRDVVFYAIAAGGACGLYFYTLSRGYASGDFTVVYPIARALPVLVIGLWDAGRGRPPTMLGWLGMALVALGCVAVPQRSFSDLRLSRYFNKSSIWILGTAGGTIIYSMLDKLGQENIAAGPGAGPGQAAVYGYVFYVSAGVVYFIVCRLFGGIAKPTKDPGWRVPALTGSLSFASYWLILWVYQMTPRASYVVAFRQFSIVVGVVVAFILFGEAGRRIRTIGAFVIAGGLIVLQVWGG